MIQEIRDMSKDIHNYKIRGTLVREGNYSHMNIASITGTRAEAIAALNSAIRSGVWCELYISEEIPPKIESQE